MKLLLKLLLVLMLLPLYSLAQNQDVSYSNTLHSTAKFAVINVGETNEDWNFRITQFKEITEGNSVYRQHLLALKRESAIRFPRTEHSLRTIKDEYIHSETSDHELVINRNFQGNLYSNSVPNDNTIAVSNGGQLISAINTNIYFYDLLQDSLMKTMSLNAFSAPLTGVSTHQYDPKLLYDPHQDRFVIVFLAGASSDTKTDIVVGFSETNDMLGNWFVYSLSGNPLNDTSWTDFPAIAFTEEELFITVNLLNYGTNWQTSFKQSVVWQVNKFDGYNGDELKSKLWYNIACEGKNIRNINPIQGADRLAGPNIYLLSSCNFTLFSDTIFLMEITGALNNSNAKLHLHCLKSDVGYGAPPDAKQPKTLKVLATNDARVLGGFIHHNTIQFVANTIDTLTGGAAIYHGVISNINQRPVVKGTIVKETGIEFGYPNISYSGNTLFSQQAIIGFNHSGDTVYPGISAVFYDGAGGYSKRVVIKEGTTVIRVLQGDYQRWGDYTGNQRKYNEPGVVWMSGMFGIKQGLYYRLGTQIAELVSPVAEQPLVIKSKAMEASLYPNPVVNYFGMEFVLDKAENLVVELRNMSGQRVHRFYEGEVASGKSAVSFSTENLSQGIYLVVITDNTGNVLFSEKLIKVKP